MRIMGIKIWHILAAWGVVLLIGTIGAADMGAIGSGRIVLQVILGFGLIFGSYVAFVVCCDKWCKRRWSKYGRH